MREVRIGNRIIGNGHPCYVVAEIGINHNGDIDLARQLIEAAADAGCDAVKFQKRTVNVVYTEAELAKPRKSPFGTTNGDLKHSLEFGLRDYDEIDMCCREAQINWFASAWDEGAATFIEQWGPPCFKVASASLTDIALIEHVCSFGKPIILSTGMSSLHEIDRAVYCILEHGNDLVLMHTVSTYPTRDEDLNLRCIKLLRRRYELPVGYSGHEVGLAPSLAAVAMGACMIERHITLDRSMYGTDQSASVEPQGFKKLVDYIRSIEDAMGDGEKCVLAMEQIVKQKLRRVG